jgi:hypothetical protein
MYFILSVLLKSSEQTFRLIYADKYYRGIRTNDAVEQLLSK